MISKENADRLERRLERLYSEARAFTMHEDLLIDTRLKWAITISAFLFAAYGATWIAWAQADEVHAYLSLSRIAMAICGFLSAVFAATSVHAANMAISAVTRKYNNFVKTHALDILDARIQVWKLIGDRRTHVPGFLFSIFVPVGMAVVWVALGYNDVRLFNGLQHPDGMLWVAGVLSSELTFLGILALFVFPILRAIYHLHQLRQARSRSASSANRRSGVVTRISEKSFETRLFERNPGEGDT